MQQSAEVCHSHGRAVRPSADPSLEGLSHDQELWEQILAYDLSDVTKAFCDRNTKYGVNAKKLEVECKRFLYLATIAMNLDMAPTKPIDEYWHQFILFTEEYERFCDRFAGCFMHHRPFVGTDHEMIFKRTQRLATQIFGSFEEIDWWLMPMPATSCGRMVPRVS